MFLYQSTEGLLKSVHLLNGASLQQTKEENAAFFHENGIDSYISTVFGKKSCILFTHDRPMRRIFMPDRTT